MPEFSQYVEVETEIDVSVNDFLSSCSKRELKELVDALLEDGHLLIKMDGTLNYAHNDNMSLIEQEWYQMCDELKSIKLMMTNKDEEQIKSIVNKYSFKKYF